MVCLGKYPSHVTYPGRDTSLLPVLLIYLVIWARAFYKTFSIVERPHSRTLFWKKQSPQWGRDTSRAKTWQGHHRPFLTLVRSIHQCCHPNWQCCHFSREAASYLKLCVKLVWQFTLRKQNSLHFSFKEIFWGLKKKKVEENINRQFTKNTENKSIGNRIFCYKKVDEII